VGGTYGQTASEVPSLRQSLLEQTEEKMKRRSFLKFLGLGASVAVAAPVVAKSVKAPSTAYLTDNNAWFLKADAPIGFHYCHPPTQKQIREVLRPGLEKVFSDEYAQLSSRYADALNAPMKQTREEATCQTLSRIKI
jgi:hypothetical protein